jgi:hypothetical protein
MRRRVMLTAVLSVLPVLAMGAGNKKEKTLQERMQGTWSRTNHPFSFTVKGNEWVHYDEKFPLKPTGNGTLEYPRDKDYAIVRTNTGHVWWLFSAGENVIAVETFEPNGGFSLGAGRVYYRDGTYTP